ncbi:hypothetical protein [Cognaticolwellia beringensis]|nr:hypothetical protein [Cognaticolwellia beringensis]
MKVSEIIYQLKNSAFCDYEIFYSQNSIVPNELARSVLNELRETAPELVKEFYNRVYSHLD